MSLYIASLNSGSNANCYYVGNRYEAVLIDAGLSCRETERRMKQLELSMQTVKAIFVTHEHNDHITGLASLSKKYRLPVYITSGTRLQCPVPVEDILVTHFQKNKAIRIGALSVLPFTKSHDAADPHSFMVSSNGVNIGIITDIGYACKQVIKYFGQCHAVFLESNYCDDMLGNGDYPYYLKKRISGDRGHLSNTQALELFKHYRSSDLQLLILSHLSKNNNKPELVEKTFTPHASGTKIFVASRYEASPVFCIENSNDAPVAVKQKRKVSEKQLSLF